MCVCVCKHQLYRALECQGGPLPPLGPGHGLDSTQRRAVWSAGTSWGPASQAQEHRTSAHDAKIWPRTRVGCSEKQELPHLP